MTSIRKQKKRAASQGLTVPELRLVELMEEMLDSMRWMQVLAYSNQYLVQNALETTPQERDRVLEAATRAVEADRKLHDWRARLAQLKSEIEQVERRVAPSGGEGERKARAADAE